LATVKKVPVKEVPPPVRLHAEAAKSPLGVEVIVHADESPLLNCPPLRLTAIVLPGGSGETGANAIAGVASLVKDTVAESPVFPVTVIDVTSNVAPTPTLNEPVTFPPLMLQL